MDTKELARLLRQAEVAIEVATLKALGDLNAAGVPVESVNLSVQSVQHLGRGSLDVVQCVVDPAWRYMG